MAAISTVAMAHHRGLEPETVRIFGHRLSGRMACSPLKASPVASFLVNRLFGVENCGSFLKATYLGSFPEFFLFDSLMTPFDSLLAFANLISFKVQIF
jgi:hypothetical protein